MSYRKKIVDEERVAEAYKYCMTEFMPADGEEFERDNHHSCAWDGPQTEEHYSINNYLYLRLEHRHAGEDQGLERRTHYIEHSKLEGDVRKGWGRGRTTCFSHLVMCGHDGAVTVSGSNM